jgi:L-aspartate oxidase
MTRYVGIFKSTQSLQQAEEKINDIYLEVHQFYNQNKLTNELCELRNMVSIAYLIIKQAQELNENKGVFYNHDYA